MAIIPILLFGLLFGFGFAFGGSDSSTSSSVEPATPELTAPSGPAATFMPSPVVRSVFRYREQLPSCGTINADDRGEGPWQCLQDAADSIRDRRGPGSAKGAELVRVGATPEGDPIRTYYRVKPSGEYEIFTDNHRDAFRGKSPAWIYDSCPIPDDVRSECVGS